MSQTEIRAVAAVGLLYVVRMLGLFMVLPVLPLVAPELPGATPLMLGLALGIYGASQACLQIPLGLLSDRIGRKPVILGGLVVFLIGSVVAAVADSIGGIVVGRLLQGGGAIASTLLALVSDVTRVEHRTRAMAIVGISIAVSFGLALILGPLIASLAGLPAVFWFCAVSALAGIIVVLTVVPSPRIHHRNPEVSFEPGRMKSLLRHPGLARACLGIFIVHYLLMSSFIVLPLLMRATGRIEDSQHYLYYFWLLLAALIAMLPFIWYADRRGHARATLLVTIGGMAATSIAFARVQDFYPVLAAMVCFFMAFNLMESLLPAMVSKFAPAGQRGSAMGVFTTAQFAGGFAGGLAGGFLLGGWDLSVLMYANAVVCTGWFLITWRIPDAGNYRTVTCRVEETDNVSTSEIMDALSSVRGVVDVAFFEEERLAYLKVDMNNWHERRLSEANLPAAVVVS